MKGIGVTQWQDDESDYPLRGAGSLAGIFCDANFVTFNNFIPVLTNVSLIDSNLSLAIQFDDAVQTFTTPITNAIQGNVLRLRTSSRSYGCVVFGRLIADVVTGLLGTNITTNISFESITVRTINKSNGLYSLNGLSGNVNIVLDTNMQYNGSAFSAVSMPDNIATINTSTTNLYVNTAEFGLVEINPITGVFQLLTTLDKPYTAICNDGIKFVGAYVGTGSGLYTLATIPSQAIVKNIDPNSTNTYLSMDNSGQLWGITSSGLLCYGNGSYTAEPTVHSISPMPNVIFNFGDNFMSCVNGSSNAVLYKLTPTSTSIICISIGQILLGGATTGLPPVVGAAVANSMLYVICFTGTAYPVYSMNMSTLEASLVATYDGSFGSVVSMFAGGHEIMLTPIVPLKSINSLSIYSSSSLNNIVLSAKESADYNTIKITPVSNNTLQFSLPIQDANLNVKRTIVYE